MGYIIPFWFEYGRCYSLLILNMGGVIPDIHVGDSIPDILVLNTHVRVVSPGILVLSVGGVTPFDILWYPYGRRYPGYIDLDIHMGDGIPDILILNVGGVTPELIWSWGVRSQAEFYHEGHVPKLSSFDREGYVPKLNLITRDTFPSMCRVYFDTLPNVCGARSQAIDDVAGHVPKHKRGESRKILWGTFPSFVVG